MKIADTIAITPGIIGIAFSRKSMNLSDFSYFISIKDNAVSIVKDR
ncbi:hypothetical protein ACLIX2_08145 [Proteus cibi]